HGVLDRTFGAHGRGAVRSTSDRLPEAEKEDGGERYAKPAEQVEPRAPAVVVPAVTCDATAEYRADVDARLVQPHRPGPGRLAVVVAEQRHRRRVVKRLAQPLQRPEQNQVPVLRGPPGRQGDGRPEQQPAED